MSDLEQALNILPINCICWWQGSQGSCHQPAGKGGMFATASTVLYHLIWCWWEQHETGSSNRSDQIQQKVIANPPTFVKITKKYQRKSTPALSNSSSLPNNVSGAPSRAGSPEVSSSSGPAASSSAGSLGVQEFMNPSILKTAKLWRIQKLSKGELVGLVQHYTHVTPSDTATKGQLIKSLMDAAVGLQ